MNSKAEVFIDGKRRTMRVIEALLKPEILSDVMKDAEPKQVEELIGLLIISLMYKLGLDCQDKEDNKLFFKEFFKTIKDNFNQMVKLKKGV